MTDQTLTHIFERWDKVESADIPNSSPKIARKWGHLLRGLLSLSGTSIWYYSVMLCGTIACAVCIVGTPAHVVCVVA